MKPNEDAREESRADQPITPCGELQRVEAIWRAIVEHLNPFVPEEDEPNEGTT